jgi:hypothetical protein
MNGGCFADEVEGAMTVYQTLERDAVGFSQEITVYDLKGHFDVRLPNPSSHTKERKQSSEFFGER